MKSERTKSIQRIDTKFSLFIRGRANYQCQLRGKDSVRCNSVMQCAHIITRANYRLRWDVNNALCLCAAHHCYYTYRPYLWMDIVQQHFPLMYEYVERTKRESTKTGKAERELIDIQLNQLLRGLK